MRARELLLVAGSAATTLMLTLALAWPRPAAADGEEGGDLSPVTEQEIPVLRIGQVDLTVQARPGTAEAGASLVLVVRAVNHGETAAALEASLNLQRTEAARFDIRMLPMPVEVWAGPCPIAVEAGATREFELATGHPVDAAASYAAVLQVAEEGIWAPIAGTSNFALVEVQPATQVQTQAEEQVPVQVAEAYEFEGPAR